MDLWSVHAKSATMTGSPFLKNYSIAEKPYSSCTLKKSMDAAAFSSGVPYLRILEIRVPRTKTGTCPSFVVRAMGKKNNNHNSNSSSSSAGSGDQSIPEGDSLKGSNPASESKNARDPSSQMSHHRPLDWREFRAALYIQEQQAEVAVSEPHKHDRASLAPKPLPPKWAHPISAPEDGCILLATEKLDGVRTFERTVVLLLSSGTRNPREVPVGVVINRPLHKKIKHIEPSNVDLATTFADCPLHFGGPLEASMFLLRSGKTLELPGFKDVIPGVFFGAKNCLDEASGLVRRGLLTPHDFRFFVGYAGWDIDQLREEIESDYWYVAACSANLLFGGSQNSSSEGLWEEILQLMGGHYSEVSRKPKKDT